MFDGSRKVSPGPGLKVEDFALNNFGGASEAEPAPSPGAVLEAAGFEDLSPPGRRLFNPSGPSLGYLFEPFETGLPGLSRQFEPRIGALEARQYEYAELDTRDPEVARTLKEAQEAAGRLRQQAQKEAAGLWARAKAEAEDIRARAGREAGHMLDQARRRAGEMGERARVALEQAEQARREADDVLARARAEAQKAREEAAQAEIRLEQARRDGFSQGREEGLAAGREEGLREGLEEAWRQTTARLGGLLAGIGRLYDDLYEMNEPFMIKLALETASLVISRKLAEDSRQVALESFKTALGFLSQAHRAEFTVHPADLPALEEARSLAGNLISLSFRADSGLNPGDVVMRSDVGRLDATVRNRLQAVLEPLELLYNHHPAPELAAAASKFSDGGSPEEPAQPAPEKREDFGPPEAAQNRRPSGEPAAQALPEGGLSAAPENPQTRPEDDEAAGRQGPMA